MLAVSRLLPILLLALSILGISWTHNAYANSVERGSLLPHVQHPILYSPLSLSKPGSPPFAPSDIRKGYDFLPLYTHGIKGNGTRIAIVDAFGDSRLSQDLSSFDSLTGLPAATMNTYYPDGQPSTTNSGWALETALDVEWAHAIAPSATIDLVVAFDDSLGSVYDGISFVAGHLTSETVLSMSFGLSESQFPTTGNYTIALHHQLFATMASHGTSMFASSGDSGSSSCCDVSYPASDPLVVAVGGTTLHLDGSASYLYDSVWSGSGAGSSLIFAKPSWQNGLGDSMRDIADVSYDANPSTGVIVVQGGSQFTVGGTSAGSPQWAALMALASQAANTRFGSIGAKLYNLTSYHDVTIGSNGFFPTGPGWDYPTGLGTPDASLIVSGLIQPPTPLESSSTFQGLNVTTTGSLQVNTFTSTVSGTARVVATNSTTGLLVFSKNYTISNVLLQNMTTSQSTHFLLSIPLTPYPLSSDITLTLQGTKTTTQVAVSRDVNISGSGSVNINDVTTVISDYGSSQGSPGYNPQADLGATGMIGISDVTIAILYYGAPVFN